MNNPNKDKELIKQAWDRLANHIKLDINSIQYKEMRKAFFIGAFAMYEITVISVADLAEKEAFKILTNINEEMQMFRQSIVGRIN